MPVTIYRRVLTHVLFDLHFSCDASPSPASPKATRQKKSRETVPSQLQSVPSLLRVQTHLHVQSGYKLHKAGDPHFLLPSLQPCTRPSAGCCSSFRDRPTQRDYSENLSRWDVGVAAPGRPAPGGPRLLQDSCWAWGTLCLCKERVSPLDTEAHVWQRPGRPEHHHKGSHWKA